MDFRDIATRSVPTGKGWSVKSTKSGKIRIVTAPGWDTPTVGYGQEDSWDQAVGVGGLTDYTVPQFGDPMLTPQEAIAACGPAAAVAFARATGRTPTLSEALTLAKEVGWDPQNGMYGPQAQANLFNRLGVNAELFDPDWTRAQAETEAGRPVAISTPGHYFVAQGYNPDQGYFVSNSGTAYKEGKPWMTQAEMEALGGASQGMFRLADVPAAPDVGTSLATQQTAPMPDYQPDPNFGGALRRWQDQFGGTEQDARADLARPESREYMGSALGMARAGEVENWKPVGSGQDSWGAVVGTGADDSSFFGYLSDRWQQAQDEWGRGDWGGAVGTATGIPFEAINKGLGYVVGGPVMGGAAAVTGQAGPIDVAAGYNAPLIGGINRVTSSYGAPTVPGASSLDDVLDYAKAQQRWQALNPLVRLGGEMAAGFLAPTAGLRALDTARAKGAVKALESGKAGKAEGADIVGTVARTGDPTALERVADKLALPARVALTGGPVAAGLVAGATMPDSLEGESPGLLERGVRGLSVWGGTSMLGYGINALPGSIMRAYLSRRPGLAPVVREGKDAFSPELQDTLDNFNRGQMMAEGFRVADTAVPPIVFPVGNTGRVNVAWGSAQAEAKMIDSAAFLKPWVPRVERLVKHKLSPDENPLAQFRLMSGNARAVEALSDPMILSYNAQLRDKIEKNNLFGSWLLLKLSSERAARGIQTGRVKTLDDARAQLRDYEAYLTRLQDKPGMAPDAAVVARFNKLAADLTTHHNMQLRRMADANVISSLEAGVIAKNHQTYALLKDIEFLGDRMSGEGLDDWFGDQAKFGMTYLARTRGLDREHMSGNIVHTDVLSTLQNFAYRENLLNKNKMFVALEKMRQLDPDGFGRFFLPSADGSRLPTGWNRLPGFIRAMNPALKENAAKVLGMDPKAADLEKTILAKLASGELTHQALSTTKALNKGRAEALAGTWGVKHAADLTKAANLKKLENRLKEAAAAGGDDAAKELAKVYDDVSLLGSLEERLATKYGLGRLDDEGDLAYHARLMEAKKDAGAAEDFDIDDILYTVEKRWLMAPKEVHDSLMGISAESLDAVSRAMGKFNGIFRAGVTGLSIPFLFRNPIRDLETALVNMGTNSVTVGAYVNSLLDSITGGKLAELFNLASKQPALGGPNGLWDRLARGMRAPAAEGTPFKDLKRWQTEMMEARGGLGTFSEQLRSRSGFERVAQKLDDKALVGAFDVSRRNPVEVVRTMSEALEMATRVAVYQVKRKALDAGVDVSAKVKEMAAWTARDATVDFSRSGQALRAFNAWIPLLNARMQGTYRTYEAVRDDPTGFFARGTLLVGIPALMTHYHNMENFPDEYAKIPPEVKDRYYTPIFGRYSTPLGESRPLYFTIPKDAWHQLLSTPLEWMLDLINHSAAYGGTVTLEGGQRTERDLAKMLKDEIANQLPISYNTSADTLLDPVQWGMAFLQAIPYAGAAAQLGDNQDWSRGAQPIVPDGADYAQSEDYFDFSTGPFASWVAKEIGVVGQWKAAPSQVAFAARALGGTAGTTFMDAGDVIVEALGWAAPEPTNAAELSRQIATIPQDDPQRYEKVARLQAMIDYRPEAIKYLRTLIGTSGGQQTQAAKVRQMSQRDQQVYQHTHEYQARKSKYMMTDYRTEKVEIERGLSTGSLNHEQARARYQQLGNKIRDMQEAWKRDLPLAISDPAERRAFHDRMPGIPLQAERAGLETQMLSPDKLKEAADRYKSPPSLEGNEVLLADPHVVESARSAELMKMAREWQVDPNDLRDQIASYTTGRRLPTVVLPAIWMDDAVAAYRAPRVMPDGQPLNRNETAPEKITMARKAEMARLAKEWTANGYPITAEDLTSRVQIRLTGPESWSATEASYERAMTLATVARDPVNFPKFSTPGGQPLNGSGPELWEAWTTQIEEAKTRYNTTDADKLPPQIKMLIDARKWGEVNRLKVLTASPDYAEYQRWFGFGAKMNETDWDAYMTGELQRYRGVRDPDESNRRDSYLKMYSTLPSGSPLKAQMKPMAGRIRQTLDPGWRRQLEESDRDIQEMEMMYREAVS